MNEEETKTINFRPDIDMTQIEGTFKDMDPNGGVSGSSSEENKKKKRRKDPVPKEKQKHGKSSPNSRHNKPNF